MEIYKNPSFQCKKNRIRILNSRNFAKPCLYNKIMLNSLIINVLFYRNANLNISC